MMTIDEFLNCITLSNLLHGNKIHSLLVTNGFTRHERFHLVSWGELLPTAVSQGSPTVFSLNYISISSIKLHEIVAGPITQAHYVRLTGEIVPVDKDTDWEPEWDLLRFALGTSQGKHIKYEYQL